MAGTDFSCYLDAIETALQAALMAPEPALESLYGMMQYHLGWRDEALNPVRAPRGKRLRPLLCLLACQCAGGEWQQALPAAAALELIHNFTLIHDDIEDNSTTRRHRRTVWKLWGLAQGVNTGDTMWSSAKNVLFQLRSSCLSCSQVLDVMVEIESACMHLCQGQYLDIAFESAESITIQDYQGMIAGKTAALLAAATASGALVAGAEKHQVDLYRTFGRQLGLAFQMQDDILGIWGDPAVTGKSAADDLINRKKTYPVLYTLAWERARGNGDLAALLRQPAADDAFIRQALKILERADAQEATGLELQHALDEMLATLDQIDGQPLAAGMLRELATGLVGRAY
ncbi:MAG: polyprenyl synthetase family protein [Anaerolineae bacterium]